MKEFNAKIKKSALQFLGIQKSDTDRNEDWRAMHTVLIGRQLALS